jgi:hypothetical protein
MRLESARLPKATWDAIPSTDGLYYFDDWPHKVGFGSKKK